MLKRYEIKFYVDGKRTMQVVMALSLSDAKKIIMAQYPQSKINITFAKRLED